ncbi:MAG: TonB-dependent receptor, partial [Synechococcales bacterium]|nr:TonB-dependent receptor [Synechococcales bacterium]
MMPQFLLKMLFSLGCCVFWVVGACTASAEPAKPNSLPTQVAPRPLDHPTPPMPPVHPDSTVSPSPLAQTAIAKPTQVHLATPVAQATPFQPAIAPILSPLPNAVLDNPATSVVVQYAEGQPVVLQVNGQPVPKNQIGRTEVDSQTKQVTQTFYGVGLQEGKNRIQTWIGNQVVSEVVVQVRGVATTVKLKPERPSVPADGRSTVTIHGQLLDEQGNRSNRDAWVTLASEAGDWVGADGDPDQAGFQVKALQGQFQANLRSGLEAKPVTIRAIAGKAETFTQVQFTTNLRSSIATGVVSIRLGNRGTDYYNRRRDFLPLDRDNALKLSAKGSLFVMGSVGEWLITGAYNSDRPLNETCDGGNRLFRELQACEHNYPVYGDSSSSSILAPSTDQVFFRIERTSPVANAGSDYAQWGDYRTEEWGRASQQFTATQRNLHGAKLNYNLGDLQITGFYGNNIEGFQRDTIAPDGTSGYYFLSRRLLVEGSENVFLETEELDRPGTVIERKNLSRGQDYDIDYDRGSLLFRQPVLRTDVSRTGEILVRRIVVTYQYEQSSRDNHIFGGRLQYHLVRTQGRESWLGATYVKEKQGNRNFELYGADAYVSLGDRGRLIAEYAHSQNDSEFLGPVSGSAYRVEIDGQIAKGIQGRAYYRSTETGFANNATTSFVPGQTRYGAQIAAAVSPTTHLRLQYDHEDNRGIAPRPLTTLSDLLTARQEALPGTQVDNSLTTFSFGVQQRLGSADLSIDWLHRTRTDRLAPNALRSTSDQLRSRFSMPLTRNLTFQAQNETTLSSQVDAVYSDRTLLGLNWQAMPGVNVQLAQQFYHRGTLAGQSYT